MKEQLYSALSQDEWRRVLVAAWLRWLTVRAWLVIRLAWLPSH